MTLTSHLRKTACCLALILYFINPAPLLAEEPELQPVHWAYSAFFGTGWYQIENNRSVFALNMPLKQTLRSASFTESGKREIGFIINYPVTLGLHNIDDLPGLVQPDNFGTMSFTPGLELEIPVTQRWYLRPLLNFGWGSELGTGDAAWIYYAGLKSRITFPEDSGSWALINSLYYAGYNPDVGHSNDLAAFLTGLEFKQQLNKKTISGDNIDLHWSLAYTYLGDELTFALPDGSFDAVDDQFEAGLAFGYRNRPVKLWFMKFDSVGLGYRFSSDGQFKGISLNLGSWFTR